MFQIRVQLHLWRRGNIKSEDFEASSSSKVKKKLLKNRVEKKYYQSVTLKLCLFWFQCAGSADFVYVSVCLSNVNRHLFFKNDSKFEKNGNQNTLAHTFYVPLYWISIFNQTILIVMHVFAQKSRLQIGWKMQKLG